MTSLASLAVQAFVRKFRWVYGTMQPGTGSFKALTLFFVFTLWAHLLSASAADSDYAISEAPLSLEGPTCSGLSMEIHRLRDWATKINSPIGDFPELTQKSDGKCEANIESSVPETLLKIQKTHPKQAGPNCWNTALVMSGIVPGFRFSSPEEFNFWLNSPLCRKLENNEAPQPGDIGAIRSNGSEAVRLADYLFKISPDRARQQEWHGFIYISDQLSFSKNGFSEKSPFALQKTSDVYKTYGVDTDYNCVQTDHPSIHCENFLDFYRCKSLQQFASESDQKFSEQQRAASGSLHTIECLAESLTKYGAPGSSLNTLADLGLSMMDVLEVQIRGELKSLDVASANPTDLFYWNSLLIRIGSLREQMRLLKK